MPDIATLKDRLLQSRFIPPVGSHLFEYGQYDVGQIVEQFIANCRKLIELRGDGARPGIVLGLYDWLEKILEVSGQFPVVFFGRALYGEPGCETQDLDAFHFIPEYTESFNNRVWMPPDFVMLLNVYENENVYQITKRDFETLACGALLIYPETTHLFSSERIRKGRSEKDPENYVMERIPHTAAKILNNQELDTVDPEHRNFFIGKVLSSRYDLFVDLGSRPTIDQINRTYEDQIAHIPEPELLALSMAALKRMRVKKEHRERIAKRYVSRQIKFQRSRIL